MLEHRFRLFEFKLVFEFNCLMLLILAEPILSLPFFLIFWPGFA
jgi:hypothetical protein